MTHSSFDLVVFHYHLLPGGVTDVIVIATRALLFTLSSLRSVTVVCGLADNSDNVAKRIRADLPASCAAKLAVHVFPELSYQNRGSEEDREKINMILRERYLHSTSLWLVHNYHLGKNPFFTEALLAIASETTQKILFQIHDFPEQARYHNLTVLREYVSRPLYPSGRHIRYAVINSRDQEILLKAGMSNTELFLLGNPLEPPSPPSASISKERPKGKCLPTLAHHYGKGLSHFDPDAPFALYPVRTIRRKNIFEAGLFCLLAESRPNLVVSLPGESEAEKSYSSLVAKSYDEGLIAGLWGIGKDLEDHGLSFPLLCEESDLILSSSIQEGFGYLFINALRWGKPLASRALATMKDFAPLFLEYPCAFYDSMRFPLSSVETKQLQGCYAKKVEDIASHISSTKQASLHEEISALIQDRCVDFSFLSVQEQYRGLQRLKRDPGFYREVRAINLSFLERFDALFTSPPPPCREEAIAANYGREKYAELFHTIVSSFDAQPPPPRNENLALLDLFVDLGTLRLLFDP